MSIYYPPSPLVLAGGPYQFIPQGSSTSGSYQQAINSAGAASVLVASGSQISPANVATSGTISNSGTGTANGLVIAVGGYNSIGVTVTISGTAHIVLAGSVDGGATYPFLGIIGSSGAQATAEVTSFTASGSAVFPFRAPFTHVCIYADTGGAGNPPTNPVTVSYSLGSQQLMGNIFTPSTSMQGMNSLLTTAYMVAYGGSSYNPVRMDSGYSSAPIWTSGGGSTSGHIVYSGATTSNISTNPGRLCKVMVQVAGTNTSPVIFYDSANTSYTSGTTPVLGVLPISTPAGPYTFDSVATVGFMYVGVTNGPNFTVTQYP